MDYTNYNKVSEMAGKWNLSPRRVRKLCEEGKVPGATRKGNLYMIPADAKKPADGRCKTSSVFDEIARKMAQLQTLRPLTEGEAARLSDEFMIEFTYNSNAIEGNTLTLKETAMALEGMTIDQKPLRDHLEVIGHRDAFNFVLEIAEGGIPISESLIKQIHFLVLADRPHDRGEYRKVPVRIMGAAVEPVQPYLISPKLSSLIKDDAARKETMLDLARIALFHLEFEGIHPFIDGNGRTGRLLLNLELIRCGYPPINVKFADRKLYYEAFDAYYQDGDADKMTSLIAGYVSERLDDYLNMLL